MHKNAERREEQKYTSAPKKGPEKKNKKNREKVLTKPKTSAIIVERLVNGGIAQLARAFGSYPTGRWFKSDFRYQARWSSG